MVRFLHAADLHLDSPLRGLQRYEGAPTEQIRSAPRKAFQNLVQLALREQVQLVVIAGDIYDGDWQDHNTGLFFVRQISQLTNAGIHVIAINGNHDAARQMTRTLPLPRNPDGTEIMLSCDSAETRCLENIGVAVHGRSFADRAEEENLVMQYPAAKPGLFNIGVLHTSLTGSEGHNTYAPCRPIDLMDKQYHYWALGHIHQRGQHHDPDDPLATPIWFSGNIQGRHVRETGPKGCLIVDVDAKFQPRVRFEPLDVVRWQVAELDVSELDSIDDIHQWYADWLDKNLNQAASRLVAHRINLSGRSVLHQRLHHDHDALQQGLRARAIDLGRGNAWLETVKLRTKPVVERDKNELLGPLGCVEQFFESVHTNETLAEIKTELAALKQRLPVELIADPIEPMQLDHDQFLAELLAESEAFLKSQLLMRERQE